MDNEKDYEYQPLTKQIVDNGRLKTVCSFKGTEKCLIHKEGKSCQDCPIFQALLEQLNTFERIYLDKN